MLVEDIRAQYLNSWLALLSTRGSLDDGFVERFELSRASVDWAFAQLLDNSAGIGPAEEEHVRELIVQHRELVQSWTPVITMLLQGRAEEAQQALSGDIQDRSNAFVDSLSNDVQTHRFDLNRALTDSIGSRGLWERSALFIGGLWIALLVGGSYAAHRFVLRPLSEVARAARLIAAGEVHELAPIVGPAEIARIGIDVNLMAISLISRSRELSDYLSKNLEARTAELEIVNEALRSSEARLNAVIESAPLILFALDAEGRYTLTKGKALAAFALEPGALDGRSIYEVFQDNPQVCAVAGQALAGQTVSMEIGVNAVVLDTYFAPLLDEKGVQRGVIGVGVDVSERKYAEDALRDSEERYKELFENANDIVYTHDLEGRFTSMNKACIEISGYTAEELQTMSMGDLLTPEVIEEARAMLRRKMAGEEVRTTYEAEIRAKDQTIIPLEFSARLIYENGVAAAVQGIGRDISDRRRAERALLDHARQLEGLNGQLRSAHSDLADSKREVEAKSRLLEQALEVEREMSKTDPLTGALNHGAIVAELRAIVEHGPEGPNAAVIMLDIDGMKAANDMYGHPFGDEVLIAVKDALSRDGALVGRYGGDEFVAILKGADAGRAEDFKGHVVDAVAHAGLKDPVAGTEVRIVVSVGYSLFPKEAAKIEELIALADTAMYANKRQRPVQGVVAATRRLGGELAVRVLGEIVPILTAGGDLRQRLSIVCQRLAAEFDYDGVEVTVNPLRATGRDLVVNFPAMPDAVAARWQLARRSSRRAVQDLLEKTRRPVIIDRPQDDSRLGEYQRGILRAFGIRSLLIAPLYWEGSLIGSLSVATRREGAFGPGDGQILLGLASQVSAIVCMDELLRDFRARAASNLSAHKEGARLLAWTVEAQAGVLSHDFGRMAAVATALALRLGFAPEPAEQVGIAAMLHDVGKYRVPPAILSRPQDLTQDDWDIVKRHTLWGYHLLKGHPAFEPASHVARWHHERWDGHGYPDGLAGDEIPLPVAIASVADALDAMVYDRIYREGMQASAALRELINGSGSHFNPGVVKAVTQLFEEGGLPLLTRMAVPDAA